MTAPREDRSMPWPTLLGARPAAGVAALRDEVMRGLRAQPKTLPPKLFYDKTGAELFERITQLPEYYLTRTELAILEASVDEIAMLAGPQCALIEYGSGAGRKVRLLLDALTHTAAYVPIDISREQLATVGRALSAEYPRLDVRPLHADYTQPFALPSLPTGARRLAFFPGSTIGNFSPMEAEAFLRRIRRTVGAHGALVLGVDRRKDPGVLLQAYDDSAGVTAMFNLNILRRLNRELGADFDLASFRHRALFDESASRIEMHLVSRSRQTVIISGEQIIFERGEDIWTESSYKYDRERLEQVVSAAGFAVTRLWSDADDFFWVAFLTPETPR